MKKILSLMLFVAFVFSSLWLANANEYYNTFENYWFSFDYPKVNSQINLEIKEEWWYVNIMSRDNVLQGFKIVDISDKGIEKFLDEKFWGNRGECWKYGMELDMFDESLSYRVWQERSDAEPWTSEYMNIKNCDTGYVYFVKYSPVSEKVIVSKWFKWEDCGIIDSSGRCNFDVLFNSVVFTEKKELSSEDKTKVQNVFDYIIKFVNKKATNNAQKLMLHTMMDNLIGNKMELLTWDKFLLFHHLYTLNRIKMMELWGWMDY